MESESENLFRKIFPPLPIMGMIHLAAPYGNNPIDRAIREIEIFEEEGIDAAIVENYHGSYNDVALTFEALSARTSSILMGVNILPDHFSCAFSLGCQYGARFIQLDNVAGHYYQGDLPVSDYIKDRMHFSDMAVLGGGMAEILQSPAWL